MSKIRFFIALWAAKLSVFALKITRHNGTNFPGVVALKICPDFLRMINKPKRLIGVTGTNGKTTVCNLAVDMFREAGENVLNNNLGSNIDSGISTAFISGVNIFGRCRYERALIEIDERSAPIVFKALKPELLLINNLTRDSIMRNGHPEYIARILTEEMPQETRLLINGDDLIASGIAPSNERKYFGIERMATDVEECINLINDMQICPVCNGKLKYHYLRYHHIGKAYCPNCGFKPQVCHYSAQDVDLENMSVVIEDEGVRHTYRLLNDSVFNIYNVVAVVSLFRELGYEREQISALLEKVNIVKSRFSEKKIGDYTIVRQMSKDKNALGASRAFDYVSNRPGDKELILMMNCLGDVKHWSENICWLYDADFEFLNKDEIKNIIVTGPRAKDYYLRLMLAGVPGERVTFVEKELEAPKALKLFEGESIYLFYGTDSIVLANNVVKNIEKVIEERGEA